MIRNPHGVDYLVMEYLEGQTLAERLNKRPLPIEEVLRYALQICEALYKAHRKGVVHRDYGISVVLLSEGKRLEARHHFQECVRTRAYPWSEYGWARALLKRLERDPNWPPWISVKN